MATDGLVPDRWLAEIVGKPVFRVVDPDAAFDDLQSGPVFAYAKVPTDALAALGKLETFGFRLVDTNVVFEKPVSRVAQGRCGHSIGFAAPEDRVGAVALAARAFKFSRFHQDPAIGNDTANRIKSEWGANFFRGVRGEHMVVARNGGKVSGFLQLLVSGDGVLTIDLIGVDASARGRGVGAAMSAFAEREIPGVKTIRVGTQVANVPSIRLYERLGFRLVSAQYVLHYHLD